MRSILKFLGSIKLALALFILLASASALGTLVPQQRTPGEYRARYGASAALVTGLRLDRLYQSPGYLALLVLFGANLTVCGLTRLSPKLKRTFGKAAGFDASSIGALKLRDAFVRKGSLDGTAAAYRRQLEARRYRVRERGDGGRRLLRGRRRVLGLFGADIVHLGILIILAGGIVSGLGKSASDIALVVGETAPIPGRAAVAPARCVRDRILSGGGRQGLEEHGHGDRERHPCRRPEDRGQPSPELERDRFLPDRATDGIGRSPRSGSGFAGKATRRS